MDSFTYRKGGGVRLAFAVHEPISGGCRLTYTINREVFERTYSMVYCVSPSLVRITPSDSARACPNRRHLFVQAGADAAGDMIVFNDPEGRDGYAMSAETFSKLYDLGHGEEA